MPDLLAADIQLLRLINGSTPRLWLDQVMLGLSEPWLWSPLAFVLIVILVRRRRWDLLRIVALTVFIIIVADLIAAELFKPFFSRLRPCKTWDVVRIVAGCAGWNGFPSNHATNSAAIVTALWRYGPRPLAWLSLGLCVAVGYSRIYLGVHYPSDVLAGFLFGSCFATLLLSLAEKTILAKPVPQ